MKVRNFQQVDSQPVEMTGAQGCRVRWLVGEQDGAPNFAMREFTVAAGGYTPRHQHPYEHEVFVLEGEGEVWEGDQPHLLRAGDVVYVTPDEIHQFRNTGAGPFRFLCMVPNAASQAAVTPECGESGA